MACGNVDEVLSSILKRKKAMLHLKEKIRVLVMLQAGMSYFAIVVELNDNKSAIYSIWFFRLMQIFIPQSLYTPES